MVMVGGLMYEWSQSNEDVKVIVKTDNINKDQGNQIEVEFTDTEVYIKLPDGRSWTWVFSNDIFKESSRVKMKKQQLTFYMKKKQSKMWEHFEANMDILPSVDRLQNDVPTMNEVSADDVDLSPSVDTVQNDVSKITTAEDIEPISLSSSHFGEDNFKVPAAFSVCIDLLAEAEDIPNEPKEIQAEDIPNEPKEIQAEDIPNEPKEIQAEDIPNEPKEIQEDAQVAMESINLLEQSPAEILVLSVQENCQKEESVMELNHIKNDIIDMSDSFMVYIYVKCVNKDNVKINFEANRFTVKFQTSSEVLPEKCKFKMTQYKIELILRKKKMEKWGNLETLQMGVPSLYPNHEGMCDNLKKDMERTNVNENLQDSTLSSVSTVKDASKKPTCKVQPLNKQAEVRVQLVTPGYSGLENLGNTCFMNGILQCLINTREFRDFFLNGDFQKDLNEDNVLGSGGRLACAFDNLCRVLWSGKHVSYQPSKLKKLVALKASQFTGFAQHDAQEFLAFLLDGLHEDLNRVKKKPYIETAVNDGQPDEVVANEAWAMHKQCNDSFIVDLFYGQYKSKLVCPVCGKISITFDPFSCLSVPLPKKQHLLPVTFLWSCPNKKPVRYMLRLSVEATIENLKENLQKKTGVSANNMRVFESYKGKIQKIFTKGTSLSNVLLNQAIIVCEVLSEQDVGEAVSEVIVVQRTLIPNEFPSSCSSCQKQYPEDSKLKRCSKCFKVGYCDHTCQKKHWSSHQSFCNDEPEPVGTPFIICIPQSRATFSYLCTQMEAYARYSVDVFQPPVKNEPAPKLSSCASSSDLSNSSQSSGSQNSLDSQSSFCSSCTITADQEQELADIETALPDLDIQMTSKGDEIVSPVDNVSPSPSTVSLHTGSKPLLDMETASQLTKAELNELGNVAQEIDNAARTFPRMDFDFFQVYDGSEKREYSSPTYTGKCYNNSLAENVLEKDTNASAVKHVLGIPSGNKKERTNPMFVIQPLNVEWVKDGDYLTDAGDALLDLSRTYCLSIDWRNNDKYKGYVLVQSKELEYNNDTSVKTASLEESSNVTLEQCLELFTEPEVLTQEEAWYCPQCKGQREATKQLSTWRLPHTLIIQLKRFSFSNVIWRDKIDIMVEFPTRGLDMSAYYIGSRPTDEPPPVYDLYGVVNHRGEILGGHYTAYVRCADKNLPFKNEVGWRLCDDNSVTSVSHEKNVVTSAAYLLFYSRRECFIPPPLSALSSDEVAEFHSFNSDCERNSNKDNDEVFKNDGRLLLDTSSSSPCEDELKLHDLENYVATEPMVVELDMDMDGSAPTMVWDNLDLAKDLRYTDMDSVD